MRSASGLALALVAAFKPLRETDGIVREPVRSCGALLGNHRACVRDRRGYHRDLGCKRLTHRKGGSEAYRCGQRAAFALRDLLGSRTARCSQAEVDLMGSVLG